MLVWLVAALAFLICLGAWHLRQGITSWEACGLFVASCIAFTLEMHYIYTKNTTDTYFVSGYVSSLVYRPSYTYTDNNRTHTEPPRWYLEQTTNAVAPERVIRIERGFHASDNGHHIETCYGQCFPIHSSPQAPAFNIQVTEDKYNRTSLNDISVTPRTYFNPMIASEDVYYDGNLIQLPPLNTLTDTNKLNRLHAAAATPEHILRLEKLNAALATRSSISLGIVVTTDGMLYEKMKRSYHGGKRNDFVLVISVSPEDGATIRHVNVLTWNNYALAQTITQAVVGSGKLNLDDLLTKLENIFQKGPIFVPQDFEKMSFLEIKIPPSDYAFILSYQLLLVIYLMTLLSLDPSTKTEKANGWDIAETWSKHGKPSSWRYYFHPAAGPAFILYGFIPFAFFYMWETLF